MISIFSRIWRIWTATVFWPAAYFDGVSVLAPDSGVADCLTTGLVCLPLEEGKQLVESLDGVEALWCTTDGEVVPSSGWSEHTN